MKQFLPLLIFLSSILSYGQAPQSFNYQGAARNIDGDILADQQISLRISIKNGSITGSNIYSETHNLTTSSLGLFALSVGNGSVISGNFSDIDWGGGSKFLNVAMDITGGTDLINMGTTQLLSTPYALYAETAGNGGGNSLWNENNEGIDYEGNVGIGTETPNEKLSVAGIIETTEGGVKFPDGTVQTTAASTSIGTGESVWNENSDGIDYAEGNVGIGTTNPENPLHIVGDFAGDTQRRLAINLQNTSTDRHSLTAIKLTGSNENSGLATFVLANDSYEFNNNAGRTGVTTTSPNGLFFRTENDRIAFETGSNSDEPEIKEKMVILNDGNVGIGTETPNEKLSVAGTIETTEGGIKFPDGTVQTTAASSGDSLWNKNNEGINYDGGNVGIGTHAPSALLSLEKAVVDKDNRTLLKLHNTSDNNDSFTGIRLQTGDSPFYGLFSQFGDKYDVAEYDADGKTSLSNSGNGLILRSAGENAKIEFITGSGNSIGDSNTVKMSIQKEGNVGIGTESPNEKLSVAGIIETTTGGVKFPDGTVQTTALTNSNSLWETNNDGINHDGNVGIGTENPTTLLHLENTAANGDDRTLLKLHNTADGDNSKTQIRLQTGASPFYGTLTQFGDNYSTSEYSGNSRTSLSNSGYGLILRSAGDSAKIEFITGNGGVIGDNNTVKMIIQKEGNVGIGTESPNEKLSVAGTIETTEGGIKFPDGTVQTTALTNSNSLWKTNNDGINYDGNVGIGTAIPQSLLTIQGNTSPTGTDRTFLRIINTSETEEAFTQVLLKSGANSSNFSALLHYGDNYENPGFAGKTTLVNNGNGLNLRAVGGGEMTFETGNFRTRMTITESGNIGIGTNSPSENLSVAGIIETTTGGVKFPDGTVQSTAANNNTQTLWKDSINSIFFEGKHVSIGTNQYSESEPTIISSNQATYGDQGAGELYLLSSALSVKHNVNYQYDPSKVSPGLRIQNSGWQTQEESSVGIELRTTNKENENTGVVTITNINQGSNKAALAIQVENGDTGRGAKAMHEVLRITSEENVGIGTSEPSEKLEVADGDIYLSDVTSGVIMTSPNGSCFKMTVSDAGAPVFTSVTCP